MPGKHGGCPQIRVIGTLLGAGNRPQVLSKKLKYFSSGASYQPALLLMREDG